MNIWFSNGEHVDFVFADNVVSRKIQKMYRHLRHVDLPFRLWDNPIALAKADKSQLLVHLEKITSALNIDCDVQRLLKADSTYINRLHELYEKHSTGNLNWTDFNEIIHVFESNHHIYNNTVNIDYRSLAGPLHQPFLESYCDLMTSTVARGDIVSHWSELGKSPLAYWLDNEPDDFARLCELAKPWLTLTPYLRIYLHDFDFFADQPTEDFDLWWQCHHDSWCQHWGVSQWPLKYQAGVIKIGTINDIEKFTWLLNQQIGIVRVDFEPVVATIDCNTLAQ